MIYHASVAASQASGSEAGCVILQRKRQKNPES